MSIVFFISIRAVEFFTHPCLGADFAVIFHGLLNGHREQRIEICFRLNVESASAALDQRNYDKKRKVA